MAGRAAALHRGPRAWADLMKSAILTYTICVALVTFLPTVLTHLIWTKCLLMPTERDKSVSQQRHDVMFALNLALLSKNITIMHFCQQIKGYFHASSLFLRPLCRAVLPLLVSWLCFLWYFSLSFRPVNSVCHLMSRFPFRGPCLSVDLQCSGHGPAVFVPCEVQREVAPITRWNSTVEKPLHCRLTFTLEVPMILSTLRFFGLGQHLCFI